MARQPVTFSPAVTAARNPRGLSGSSARAVRLRNARTQRTVRRMQKLMPWIEPSDMPAVRAWAELELIGACVFDELMQRGLFTQPRKGKPGGAVSPLLAELRNIRRAQLQFEQALGMTPMSRQMLRTSGRPAFDLVAAFAADSAAGRKVIGARPGADPTQQSAEGEANEATEVDAAE